jgi:hypothetical protein
MKTWIKIGIGVGIVAVIALFLAYKFVYQKQQPDYENMDAAFTTTARNLYEAFKSNKDEAAGKFNGEVLVLTGTLGKVETADSTITLVFIFNRSELSEEGVRCIMLPSFNQDASRLQPDGEVRIKGYCTGFSGTDVVLEHCSVMSQ